MVGPNDSPEWTSVPEVKKTASDADLDRFRQDLVATAAADRLFERTDTTPIDVVSSQNAPLDLSDPSDPGTWGEPVYGPGYNTKEGEQ